jgi:hypothetical protein
MTFRASLNVTRMVLYCEFYDGQQELEMWPLLLVVIVMYTDAFEIPVTEG